MMRMIGCWLMLAALVLAVGCGGGSEEGEGNGPAPAAPSASKVLRINLGAEPKSLDPAFVTVIPDNKALHALMEGLIVLDENGKPTPGVAESWSDDPTHTTWTFKLRKNARWHNGDPVTAHDFVYATRRLLTKSVAAPYADLVKPFLQGGDAYYSAGGLDSAAPLPGIEAVDDHTLVYRLTRPVPDFASVTFFACWLPVNEKAIKAGGESWANSPKTFVGNGAFTMADYRSGDRIVTKKADTYWDKDAIYWDSIELFMITDTSTENAAFRSGELDITQTIQLSEIEYWRNRPEFRAPTGLASYYVLFNTEAAPFDDPRVRRAFSMTIDRELISQRVTRRGEKPARGLIPASMPSAKGGTWATDHAPVLGKVDVEAARKLLADAGYGPGGKTLPPIEYSYNTSDEHKIIGEQLQAMWRDALGVDVRLQNMENAVLQSRFATGDFQMARSSWVADYPDPINFLEIHVTGGSYNRSRFANPQYDELIAKATQESDTLKRDQLLADAERLLVADQAVIAPIYDFTFSILISDTLTNVGVNNLAWINYVRSKRK